MRAQKMHLVITVLRANIIKSQHSQATNIVADVQKAIPLDHYLAAEAVIIHIKEGMFFYLGFFCLLIG